jgi:hypothetical protein
VLGGTGDDEFTVDVGGTVVFGLDAGHGADEVNLLGGTIGTVDTLANVDLGDGDDRFTVGGFARLLTGGDVPVPVVAEGVLHGVVLAGSGDDAISVQTGGVVEGGIDAGSGNDTVKLTGSDAGGLSAPVMGTAAEPADIDLGAGADRFEMIGGTVFGNLNGEGGEDPPGVGRIRVNLKPAASWRCRNSASERWRPPVQTSMLTPGSRNTIHWSGLRTAPGMSMASVVRALE